MQLPDEIHERRFDDWNNLVRGLMEVWELARLLGMERELEALVLQDRGGALTDRLARFGNECGTMAKLLSLRMRWPAVSCRISGADGAGFPGYNGSVLLGFPQDAATAPVSAGGS